MLLKNQLEQQGNWLFRWRSYLPLAVVPIILVALMGMHWPFGSILFHEVWEISCLVLSFVGLGVRVITIGHTPWGTSGRNTREQVANTLNTTGIYSVVRHPLYLGNFLIGLGVVLVPFEAWLTIIYILAFWLYYERIMIAEEGFLNEKFGEQYIAWAESTPAFIPQFTQWRAAAYAFSVRNVLKREYTALFLIVLLHSALEEFEYLYLDPSHIIEPFWLVLFGCGLAAYTILRALKRNTTLLDVEGR